jgi:hypothetical protein
LCGRGWSVGSTYVICYKDKTTGAVLAQASDQNFKVALEVRRPSRLPATILGF